MGGCRCYFRDCHVSSQKFPGMHFFRFPLKEAERYKKWREYCQMDRILKFSEVRRKNTGICARHFRPECFMNYKMDRLTLNAVPTIMRLSEDKALDFELEMGTGVLVNIEQPKQKHLLPPAGFECPLFLMNDKILLEKLNELQSEQDDTYENIELVTLEHPVCKEYLESSPNTLDNTVQILETIQVAAPSLKRPRHEEKVVSGVSDKKCRILNASNCSAGKGNDQKKFVKTVVLTSIKDEAESEEIDFVETILIENSNKLTMNSNNGQLFEPSESCISYDDFELFHTDKDEIELRGDSPVNHSNATTEQLKSQNYANSASEKMEQRKTQNQILEFEAVKQDLIDEWNIKYSLLENENRELKKDCQYIEEIKRKQRLLQAENNELKKLLKDLDSMKEKLQKCLEENQKLKNEIDNTKALKSELLSRKEETKELKKLLETFKNVDSKKESTELEVKNMEVNGLRKKVELLQKKLNDTIAELKAVQSSLNKEQTKNKGLIQQENELKDSLKTVETSFELKQNDYIALQANFEDLQLKQSALEQKYWKLLALQNQKTTDATSLEKSKNVSNPTVAASPSIGVSSLTKAQLFNGIKRYLCSSMVTLLRMEMFGNTEREWKADERQVAVDILRLGEIAYKYFTDEWRIRLPALRDARDWLSRSQQYDTMKDEEEDL